MNFHTAIGFVSAVCIAVSQQIWAADTVIGPNSYSADTLIVEGIYAKISIYTELRKDISIRLEGPAKVIKAIKVALKGTTVVISESTAKSTDDISVTTIGDGSDNSISTVIINGKKTTVKGSNVLVVQQGSTKMANIQLLVPESLPLVFKDFSGVAEIGDTVGYLDLDTTGEITVGKAVAAQLRVKGSGSVKIASVKDDLDVMVSNNANVLVKSGVLDKLNIRTSENAEASFGGQATWAKLAASGNSSMSVAKVTRRPEISISDNADISVGNWK